MPNTSGGGSTGEDWAAWEGPKGPQKDQIPPLPGEIPDSAQQHQIPCKPREDTDGADVEMEAGE